jgi:tetratricopeptide (TPR) repeat protein
MGEHKTFASYSNDKFNEHMRAAEQYLKEGKYYKAADAYTLASLYKSKDPLAYAGKSHALFAAGGYTSSALFLSRALEIFPEYARFKIDLVGMVGDRDKVESRIADIEEWIEISGSAKLQFLLGYVYYQIGRISEAKKAIDAAYEKLPDAPAVKTLKTAIDSAGAGN